MLDSGPGTGGISITPIRGNRAIDKMERKGTKHGKAGYQFCLKTGAESQRCGGTNESIAGLKEKLNPFLK